MWIYSILLNYYELTSLTARNYAFNITVVAEVIGILVVRIEHVDR